MPTPHCRELRQLQPLLSRRSLLELGMLGTAAPLVTPARAWANGGVSIPANSQFGSGSGFGKAKACILMFIWGGPSHLDTWDLKPNAPAEIRGEFQPIATTVPGIQVSEHFPKLAQRAEHLAIVRSVTHDDPATCRACITC